MTPENKPKFSHITVGQGLAPEISQADEEVIVISAAGIADGDTAADTISMKSADSDEISAQDTTQNEQVNDKDLELPRQSDKEAEDLDQLAAPMPLAQKIVLIICGVGFLVAIVLVVWFWVFMK
jgi:hypothetical protein